MGTPTMDPRSFVSVGNEGLLSVVAHASLDAADLRSGPSGREVRLSGNWKAIDQVRQWEKGVRYSALSGDFP